LHAYDLMTLFSSWAFPLASQRVKETIFTSFGMSLTCTCNQHYMLSKLSGNPIFIDISIAVAHFEINTLSLAIIFFLVQDASRLTLTT
jgi:hypothetical protein